MKPTPWPIPALAGILVLGVGATVWWRADTREAGRSRHGPAPPPTKSARHATTEHAGMDRPLAGRTLANLPPGARTALLELEELALALHAPAEVSAHEFVASQDEARRILARLSGEELEALVLCYESDALDDIALESEGLFSVPLFEAWGEEAPERAHRYITEEFRALFEGADGKVNLDDPFRTGPNNGLLPALFAGWARRDPPESFAAWEETRAWMSPFVAGGANAIDQALFASWARTDPQGAYLHLRNATETDALRARFQAQGFLSGLPPSTSWPDMAAQIGRDGFDYLDPLFAARWAHYDADAAVNWMLTQEPGGETIPQMFAEWRRDGADHIAVQWLIGKGDALPPAVRAEIFLDVAASHSEHLEAAIAAVKSLPSSSHTWSLLDQLARYDHNSFADGLADGVGAPPERLRALLDEMNAPDTVRTRVKAILENREVYHDPFAPTASESR